MKPQQAAEPTAEFLSKFKAMIQMKAKDGDISDDDVKAIFKSARGYAGGKMKAKKRKEMMPEMMCEGMMPEPPKMEKADERVNYRDGENIGETCGDCRFFRYDSCQLVEGSIGEDMTCDLFVDQDMYATENGGWRIFVEMGSFAEPPEWIPLMPKPGEFSHPEYGDIKLTPERNAHFVQNFKAAVYQSKLPINAEHKPNEDGAYGWITDMRQNSDGSVDARTEWTDLGTTAIKNDRFKYISPEWFDVWTNKATGEKLENVAVGAALTVRPFFKEGSMRPLVANEAGLHALEDSRNLNPKGRITGIWNEGTTTRTMTAFEPIKTEVKTMAEDKKPDTPTVVKGMSEDETKQFTELKTLVETQTQQIKTMGEQLAAKDTELKAATEQMKSMKEDMRRNRFREVAKDFHGDTDGHVKFMERLADSDEKGEESDLFKAYVERERGLAEQVKTSNLFTEVGHDGDNKGSSALDKMNAAAEKLQASDPKLTHAQAFTQVMDTNPKLYSEYRAEQEGRTN